MRWQVAFLAALGLAVLVGCAQPQQSPAATPTPLDTPTLHATGMAIRAGRTAAARAVAATRTQAAAEPTFTISVPTVDPFGSTPTPRLN